MSRTFGLHALGMVNVLGDSVEAIRQRLFEGDTSRMRMVKLITGDSVPAAYIVEPLPQLPERLKLYHCRNHRIAYAAYLQIKDEVARVVARFGADRVGVVLGSSTAGLDVTESAFAEWLETGSLPGGYDFKKQHSMGSVSAVISEAAGVKGPSFAVSTACTSGSKALASARGLLECGFCDAVITGGVDTLCGMTVNGFDALGAVSRGPCLPMSANRTGLNIGEGAALFIMTRESGLVNMTGVGESCDAHHMSAPHPNGDGAEAAMRAALVDAGFDASDIDYVNLHGTATPQNDAMEAKALARVFPNSVPCSSTKSMVGHCLGAAGAVELAFCWLSLTGEGTETPLPPHVWDGVWDEELPRVDLTEKGRVLPRTNGPIRMMSNSFAFGGNNCAVILEGGS